MPPKRSFEIKWPLVTCIQYSVSLLYFSFALGVFSIFNSPKKRKKKFDFTTMVPQVELFSFVFWENWRPKKKFLNYSTCSTYNLHTYQLSEKFKCTKISLWDKNTFLQMQMKWAIFRRIFFHSWKCKTSYVLHKR